MRCRLRNFRCLRRLTKCLSTFQACHKLELIPNMWFAAGFIFKYLAAPFFIKPVTPNSNSFQTMKYRVEQPYCRPTLPTAVKSQIPSNNRTVIHQTRKAVTCQRKIRFISPDGKRPPKVSRWPL
jgi:hypothetical protein